MELKNKIIIFIAVLIAILIFNKISPIFNSETEKIRRIIHAAKAATEKEELLKCISYISLNYRDKDENDRASLFLIGKGVFENYDDILIIIEDLNIKIESNNKATAQIKASGQGRRLTGEKFKYNLDTQKVEFEVVFQKEGSNWKVMELRFIDPEDFLRLLKML